MFIPCLFRGKQVTTDWLGHVGGGRPLRQPHLLGPALHQRVVGQRVSGAFFALAQGVQAVAQLARDFGLAARWLPAAGPLR